MSGAGGAAAMCIGPVTAPQVVNNSHTHTLTLTTAQVNVVAGNTMHNVSNASGHIHTVTLTAADRAMLRMGTTVRKTSSSTNDHTHGYDIQCGGS
jgi:hypothetical protein